MLTEEVIGNSWLDVLCNDFNPKLCYLQEDKHIMVYDEIIHSVKTAEQVAFMVHLSEWLN